MSAFITTISKIAVGVVLDRAYENQKNNIISQIKRAINNVRE